MDTCGKEVVFHSWVCSGRSSQPRLSSQVPGWAAEDEQQRSEAVSAGRAACPETRLCQQRTSWPTARGTCCPSHRVGSSGAHQTTWFSLLGFFGVCFLFSQKNARWKYSLLGSEVCCSQVSHTLPVLQDVSSAAGMSCKAAAGSSPGCCAPCAAWLTGWMCWSVSGCSGAACLSAGFLLSYISSNCQQSWLQGQASAQLLHLPSNCKRGHGPKDTQISAWGELICADGHSARIQALDLV